MNITKPFGLPPHPPYSKVLFKHRSKVKKTRVGCEQEKKQKSDVEMVKTHQIT